MLDWSTGFLRALGLASMLSGAAVAVSAQTTAPAPPLIDAAEFYKLPTIDSTRLSPSGRWLAIAAGFGGTRIGLLVFDLQEWKPLGVAARFSDVDIDDFHWVGDERLVYTITDKRLGGAEQRWNPGLFSVARDGIDWRQLVNTDWRFVVERRIGREPLEANHSLEHVLDDGSNEVIVGQPRTDGGHEFTDLIIKRLNVITGRATSLSYGAPPNVWRYLFDRKGEPRVAVARKAGRETVHWREAGASAWRVLSEHPAQRAPFRASYIGTEGDLYVTVVQGDKAERALVRYDFAANRPGSEPLVRTPGFDFQGYVVSESNGARALGVRVTTDGETTAWFDPAMRAFQQKVDARLPGSINRVACRRCGQPDMTAIIQSWSDRDPGQIWFYRAAGDEWRKVGARMPGIDPSRMGTLDFERIRARDGLELPLWITRPAGAASGPRPAIVLVHGGPWVRGSSWEWDADAQFLASRGWIVLEPEFRGSTGYGQLLYRAGMREWGMKMQDDLADAVAWAVEKKLVDPQRVCIAGGSYGGYATLMGLVRHPEVFRCGAAWAAVTDPRLMFKWRSDYDVITEHREHTYPELIGDPDADPEHWKRIAPVEQADKIRAPVLLAFGGGDTRVPLVHGERMRAALVRTGRPPEWVLYADEWHGWYKIENRVDFARRLERFFGPHLD